MTQSVRYTGTGFGGSPIWRCASRNRRYKFINLGGRDREPGLRICFLRLERGEGVARKGLITGPSRK